MCVVEELCGLEPRIQLFEMMAACQILEASFEKPAVPSGPRADPSSFLLSGGAVISTLSRALPALLIEGPLEARLTALGAAETCRLSLPGPFHEEEGKGGLARDRDTHQAMKPTRRRPVPHVPRQLSPSRSPCLAK